jgi:putative flippase GtrA
MMRFSRQLALFAVVGGIGFAVDTSILYAVRDDLGLYAGRLVSFMCSVLVTWLLNRTFTFADRVSERSRWGEFGIYLLLMLAGGAVNYGTYAVMVTVFAWASEQPVWGVMAGSLAGLMLNFMSARTLLFRRRVDRMR